MKRFLVTVVLGAILAIATALLVALYWLMSIVFGVLYVLTLPLHFLWRRIRAA